MVNFKSLLKRTYWKLPISNKIKENISQRRFERKIAIEEVEDEKNNIVITSDIAMINSYVIDLLKQSGKRSDTYKEFVNYPKYEGGMNIVAYYLTQFHPNPQNDAWWGKGTTEWNNVNQAVPQFVNHYQPRRPGELGYYDLRIKENMYRQIELAKNYGVNVFCFYYYWFDGNRLLERPLNMFLENKDMDIQFFYCWANENWTKRFSGTDSGVLMSITQTEENYTKFIEAVLVDMTDHRYYCIDDKPVLSVYRPSLIQNPKAVLKKWRAAAKEKIGKEIYIIAIQERDVSYNWAAEGFDAESEFQPKQIEHLCIDITKKIKPIRRDFSGKVYDYEDLVRAKRYLISENQDKKVYPAVMPMWDNTARRNFRGTIFYKATPELYKMWLIDTLRCVKKRSDLDDNLLFINAWNEWGEGAYLEPDYYYGYAYLQATREAIDFVSN